MLLTEEQASKKTCHATLAIDGRGVSCIASECMAWHWSDRPQRETRRLYKDETEIDGAPVTRAGSWRVINGERWIYQYDDADEKGEFELVHRAGPDDAPKRGYCGLAGAPDQ